MNSMERVLSDDLSRLTDRLAASIPEGALGADPHDDADLACAPRRDGDQPRRRTRLAGGDLRALTRALDDLENVWALAVWRSANEEPAERAQRLAA
jgi:hypothetical protein